MILPQLSDFFPVNDAMAKLYDGWLEGLYFKKIFQGENRLIQIQQANQFLLKNGFGFEVAENDFNNEDFSFELGLVSLTYHSLTEDNLIFVCERPSVFNPLETLTELITKFRDERDWKQFHTPKNLSMAIASEAGELMDQFLWDRKLDSDSGKVADEIADIFVYLLLLSKEMHIDIFESSINKIIQNDKNYPIEKSKGVAKKYNKL